MNVIEAIEVLHKLESKISALDKAIFKLELDKEHHHEVRVLNDIKRELETEKERLRVRLETTQLSNVRLDGLK